MHEFVSKVIFRHVELSISANNRWCFNFAMRKYYYCNCKDMCTLFYHYLSKRFTSWFRLFINIEYFHSCIFHLHAFYSPSFEINWNDIILKYFFQKIEQYFCGNEISTRFMWNSENAKKIHNDLSKNNVWNGANMELVHNDNFSCVY